MSPGDLVVPNNTPDGNPLGYVERYVYLGGNLCWHDFVGMTGERADFPRGTVGILLESQEIHRKIANRGKARTFWKILLPTGQIGWAHENWVKKL